MKMKKGSSDAFWTTPPYSNPLNRIRTMMTNLDKELSELYRKKSLELTQQLKADNASSKMVVNPTTYMPSRASSCSGRTKVSSNSTTSKATQPNQMPPNFNFERFKRYKNIALRAYQGKKIFTIYGTYNTIRRALIKRGWVEKVPPNYYKLLQAMSQHSLMKQAKDGNDYELVAISKMLEKYPTYFIWQPKGFRDGFGFAMPYRNRIRRSREVDFTTKEGLLGCIDHTHFYTASGVSQVNAPRCHRLAIRDEVIDFLKDFRLTFCRSLLLFINENSSIKPIFDNVSGTIPVTTVNFAIDRLNEAMQEIDHEDINIPMDMERSIDDEEWTAFLTKANKVINEIEKLKADPIEFSKLLTNVKQTLVNVKRYFPTMESDGYYNIWILKPAYCCRGSGIVLMKDYDSIVNFSNRRLKTRYVVQKYIERPLLIYKTKFDIRQYILVTINENVNIWMYKDCYLKFSSQEFNLKDLRESVHLTNNTVQRKYKNGARSDKLPTHNMWNLSQFQSYLKSIDKEDIWSKKIYPGLKENVIAVVLASLEETDLIVNNFELYGCDFMLDEDYNPALIEINATPDMSASTCVTAKICPAALDDLVKVVVDVPKNPQAPTGNFELIFKIACSRAPTYANGLTIQGTKMNLLPAVPDTTTQGGAFSKLIKKRFLSAKKKIPKVITEEDVKECKEEKPKAAVKKENQPKPFKKRKRAGAGKIMKKIPAKSGTGGKVSSNGPSPKKVQPPKNTLSANAILKKSIDVLNELKTQSNTDEVIGQKIKAVMSGVSGTNSNKKTPGRLSAGGAPKISLTSDAKELLALKTASISKGNKKEDKILMGFMDIVMKKMAK